MIPTYSVVTYSACCSGNYNNSLHFSDAYSVRKQTLCFDCDIALRPQRQIIEIDDYCLKCLIYNFHIIILTSQLGAY